MAIVFKYLKYKVEDYGKILIVDNKYIFEEKKLEFDINYLLKNKELASQAKREELIKMFEFNNRLLLVKYNNSVFNFTLYKKKSLKKIKNWEFENNSDFEVNYDDNKKEIFIYLRFFVETPNEMNRLNSIIIKDNKILLNNKDEISTKELFLFLRTMEIYKSNSACYTFNKLKLSENVGLNKQNEFKYYISNVKRIYFKNNELKRYDLLDGNFVSNNQPLLKDLKKIKHFIVNTNVDFSINYYKKTRELTEALTRTRIRDENQSLKYAGLVRFTNNKVVILLIFNSDGNIRIKIIDFENNLNIINNSFSLSDYQPLNELKSIFCKYQTVILDYDDFLREVKKKILEIKINYKN